MIVRPDGRLTRQGRLLRTSLVCFIVVIGVVVGSRASADGPSVPAPADTYTVASGETLWEIASTLVSPGESTQSVVNRILQLNHMDSATIHPGDQILVPITG
jgi:LysM repeat protein